jgi:hypothetical protein
MFFVYQIAGYNETQITNKPYHRFLSALALWDLACSGHFTALAKHYI